ncbi:AraC family transcriptional regulator [Tuwongella immobilis]|uniref:HTH araC/xylS-type domain-containing protein n=1 Tax=Tuwongella immobilis TaxID=692036 RepID=A0A6C2YU00_9BACT|nr:AraC family transcriptional regulator [Tuwongella immobilis]VIP04509.1 family transcriptional regulator : DNA-binding domain-containing protein, AraC-type OS=Singulisphaera acidiphila (strain ATCC BAA-1392 / DSM 18658 / VKM B-2454 / MOB10) GN=Sinac_5492 PE=4 SV=1: AraC_N: HTH_18 [Tuwongella immobilis]VTS06380.1 family transcriptional regulator : DNA-binding domain-containing protein, AraC-type OS=Singulisphaera acidiphila (strain ATCC BAA-1392 / DSM 18658 / VKM B-2454 / MOB10) GN=Sinac_5492 PE
MSTSLVSDMAGIIRRHLPHDGMMPTAIPGLALARSSTPTVMNAVVYDPCMCVIVQGAKEVIFAGETLRYDSAQWLLVSVAVPVAARVVEATTDQPCLMVHITLDPAMIGEWLTDGAIPPSGPPSRGLAITPSDASLFQAITRFVGLLDTPADIGPLAPLIRREMIYRILTGPQGARLRQMAATGGIAQRITAAVRWLKEHLALPLHVEALARQSQMSPSAFHLHFKEITGLSPLQYQKRLRLQEARRLMVSDGLDAASAAYRVGYESPSQFSREYRRCFGVPPRQDVAALLRSDLVTG